MNIKRVVPDIKSQHLAESRTFYVDFLGFEMAMDMGFVMTFVSPSNPTAQITVMKYDGGSTVMPDVSVEVSDVDEVHTRAVERERRHHTRDGGLAAGPEDDEDEEEQSTHHSPW